MEDRDNLDEASADLKGEVRWAHTIAERSSRSHSRRTLVKLLNAAVAEFAEYGWHGARMARLPKRAGTSHGTVYAYFADKDDLLFALWEDVGSELLSTLMSIPAIEPGAEGLRALRDWVTEVCACFHRHGAVFHAAAQALSDEENSRTGHAALRAQKEVLTVFADRIRATGSTGVDPAMGALCVYALIEGANESVYLEELMVSEDELHAGVAEFVQRSVLGSDAATERQGLLGVTPGRGARRAPA
jgi:AcrR family transcriptional regulator